MKIKKIATTFGLAAVAVAGLTSCGEEEAPVVDFSTYSDEEMYDAYMQVYEDNLALANSATSTSERYYYFAKAEAHLLDKGLVVPTTTQGGTYALSRTVVGSVPYVLWGTDNEKLKDLVVVTNLVTNADRATLKAKNQTARDEAAAGGYNIYSDGTHTSSYDPVAEAQALGYTVKRTYNTFDSVFPQTYDISSTYRSADSRYLCNYTDYLVQYDNAGNIIPALAESWSVSEDGLTYTFNIRQNATWSNYLGEVETNYGTINAGDFVTGMDRCAEAGATSYMLDPIESYEAVDNNTLKIVLKEKTDYFLTYLTYNSFVPVDSDYVTAQGENFGATPRNILYSGAFTCSTYSDTSFTMAKNPNYWDADDTKLDTVIVALDSGGDPTGRYNSIVSNDNSTYDGGGLNTTMIALAEADGNLNTYAYITDTNATTYLGAFNMNRKAFQNVSGEAESVSPKSDDQKVDTRKALVNTNFRKAVIASLNKTAYNAASTGEAVAAYSLRNTLTPTGYVTISEDTHGYEAGTSYGDIVLSEMQKLGSYVTNLADGQDAYYNVEKAKQFINAAFIELGLTSTDVIYIDYPYYTGSTVGVARGQALKQSIESALGGKVVINLIGYSTSQSYYNAGYYIDNAAELNYDFDISSGWGPDYGDPSSYLAIFSRNGDMIKISGINAHTKGSE